MDLPITQEDYNHWKASGELIQNCFPDLFPEQREFLMTGVTPEEWDTEFPDDEEEEDIYTEDEETFPSDDDDEGSQIPKKEINP